MKQWKLERANNGVSRTILLHSPDSNVPIVVGKVGEGLWYEISGLLEDLIKQANSKGEK